MEKGQFERIETLLQIIADELYAARLDRQLEGTFGPDSTKWLSTGRNELNQRIEKMREQAADTSMDTWVKLGQ